MSAPPGVVDVRSERLRDFLVASLVMLGLGFAWLTLKRFAERIDSPPPVAVAPPAPAPKPRGRCYLGPSRVRPVRAVPTSGEALALCAREPHGCVFDSIGAAYALEEPFQIYCVAPGDGRR